MRKKEIEGKFDIVIRIAKEKIKAQLAETAKKSHPGQHAGSTVNLADVNKDIVILGHEEKRC